MTDLTDLAQRLRTEADLCRNDGANDIAALLDEAVAVLTTQNDVWPIVNIDVDEAGAITNAKLYAPGLPAGNHDVYPVRVPYMDEHTEAWLTVCQELCKVSPGFLGRDGRNGIESAIAVIRALATHPATEAQAPASEPATIMGAKIITDPSIPDGEAHLVQDGKRVATITGLAPASVAGAGEALREAAQALVNAWPTGYSRTTHEAMAALEAALAASPVAQAPAAAPKSLDDPRLQELFTSCIDGALTSGYQGASPPPEGHWLAFWWKKGQAVAMVEEGARRAAAPAAALLNLDGECQRLMRECLAALKDGRDSIRDLDGAEPEVWQYATGPVGMAIWRASKLATQAPAAGDVRDGANVQALRERVDAFEHDFIENYALDDGEHAPHTPSEFESLLILDAISGVLADEDWQEAYHAWDVARRAAGYKRWTSDDAAMASSKTEGQP